MTGFALPAPGLRPIDLIANAQANAPAPNAHQLKARAAAQDFEAVFLNSMFQQMYTGVGGDGPFGGSGATGVWRSFLTQAYAKSFAQSGGIGIADQVYKTLLGHQETQQ
ncbi:MAG TPA: flagellar assembly peptidoglycan hydrolase FlgJ [Pseudolabrys sp.]|jgi:Rod binding domain-containing protein|nr:flagellar assembly peptidoglycan hydrolase FlgJ [Pseudolabrys sp.]